MIVISPAVARQIAADEKLALELARQDAVDAGHKPTDVVSDKQVIDLQTQRLYELVVARPALRKPVNTRTRLRSEREQGAKRVPEFPRHLETYRVSKHTHKPVRANRIIGKRGALVADQCGKDPQAREILPAMFDQVKVRGDGNCGFYALTAGLLHYAVAHTVDANFVQGLRGLRPSDESLAAALSRLSGAEDINLDHAQRGFEVFERIAEGLQTGDTAPAQALLDNPTHLNYAQSALRLSTFAQRGAARADIDAWATDEDLQNLVEGFGLELKVYGNGVNAANQTVTLTHENPAAVTLLNHDNQHYTLLLPRI